MTPAPPQGTAVTTPPTAAGATPPPLTPIMLLSFLASVGTYIVESGVFFLTKHTYQFSEVENYALGCSLGTTYIVGAAGASKWIALARRVVPGIGSRGILTGMMLVMTVLCAVPWAARRFTGDAGAEPAHWPMWVLVLIYSPLTGVMWPMIESYVSGGRSGPALRSAMSRWNVVWSSALVVGSIGMARFVEEYAAEVVLSLAALHLSAAFLTMMLSPEPAPHPSEAHHAAPLRFRQLLVTFRWLLPMSYVVSSAMIPFLPSMLKKLGIAPVMQTVYSAAWLATRTLAFFVFQRTSGWHGRWRLPALGLSALLGGFALCAMSYLLSGAFSGITILVLGLCVFGVGMGCIYMGGIYYAMEVGKAEVDAGGTHEALIGVGYTLGPAIGLLAASAQSAGRLEAKYFEPAVLGGVGAVCLAVAGVVVARIMRMGRDADQSAGEGTPLGQGPHAGA